MPVPIIPRRYSTTCVSCAADTRSRCASTRNVRSNRKGPRSESKPATHLTIAGRCTYISRQIGTATGQHSFAHEQAQLVAERNEEYVPNFSSSCRIRLTLWRTRLQGGSSKVDILICTPGRLIDHLNGTPNFSLQHLRFLVSHRESPKVSTTLKLSRRSLTKPTDFSRSPSKTG